MFFHIGHDRMIPVGQVLVILDAGILAWSPETRQMFNRMRAEGHVEDLPPEERKSLILTDAGMVASPISSVTLMRRALRLSTQVRRDAETEE